MTDLNIRVWWNTEANTLILEIGVVRYRLTPKDAFRLIRELAHQLLRAEERGR